MRRFREKCLLQFHLLTNSADFLGPIAPKDEAVNLHVAATKFCELARPKKNFE